MTTKRLGTLAGECILSSTSNLSSNVTLLVLTTDNSVLTIPCTSTGSRNHTRLVLKILSTATTALPLLICKLLLSSLLKTYLVRVGQWTALVLKLTACTSLCSTASSKPTDAFATAGTALPNVSALFEQSLNDD